MYSIISKSEENTKKIGFEFASKLYKNDIILLEGDLGAGKTKFTEGFLKYYNLENEISSPTFTIVNEYKNEDISIFHFDLYRLSNEDEFFAIGGEEYLNNGICIFEWPRIIENIIPKEHIKIKLNKDLDNMDYRKIEINAYGERLEKITKEICLI